MGLNLQVITTPGGVVPIDDSGAITGYVNALPLAVDRAATNAAVPAAYAPGGTPITATGRIAYANAAVAFYSQGTPYTSDGRIATGPGPAIFYDQGMPYNAAGQLVVQSSAISPPDLFAAGELGGWYDPSDLTTMWQDSARTTPVTAAGQPVGAINDKSGRGNHLTQATAASRPMLQTEGGRFYLDFDGVDDGMVSPTINFAASNVNQMSVWAGAHRLLDTPPGALVELSVTSASSNGVFMWQAPGGTTSFQWFWRSRGTSDPQMNIGGQPTPQTAVITGLADITGDMMTGRLNGVQVGFSSGDQGTGPYGNYPMYVGRRGGSSQPFKGRIYGLIVRGAATPLAQVQDIERWLAAKTGVTVP